MSERNAAMLIKIRKSWEMRESEATPEAVFHDRRRLVKSIAATPILASAGAAILAGCYSGEAVATEIEKDPTSDMYPVMRNLAYRLDREITARVMQVHITLITLNMLKSS